MAREAPAGEVRPNGRLARIFYRAPLAVVLLGLALGLWAFWFEPRRLVVNRQTIALPGWPFDGLRVAALTDVHTGSPHTPIERVRRTVARMNAEKPDLIVLLGDYVVSNKSGPGIPGGSFVPPEATAEALAALSAPLGTVTVLGNHDWWFDGERTRRSFVANGIPVLENEALEVKVRGRSLFVVGLADPWTRKVDVPKALASVPEGAPVLVLVHNPDIFPSIPARVSLTLAGHTHGGQVRFPFVGAPIVPSKFGQRYVRGHVVEEGRHLFVTTGLGMSVFPVRFCVPPEVALLTLKRAE